MKLGSASLAALLIGCSSEDGSPAFGASCGLEDLQYEILQDRKLIRLNEPRYVGSRMTEDGEGTTQLATPRQEAIERALPCLEEEAARHGLEVDYPSTNVDAF